MKLALILLLALSSVEGLASAQARTDDSDLAGHPVTTAVPLLQGEGKVVNGVHVFKAQRLGGVTGKIVLVDPQGNELPGRYVTVLQGSAQTITDAKGEYTLPANGSGTLRLRLENKIWSITDPATDKAYEWELAPGANRLDPNTANGKIAYIHLQLLEAVDLFDREGIGMKWWAKQLTVIYPGDADYFSPWNFTLNLTQPHQWDVNLHEFGHAVMAAGMNARGGGGQHKIDECYNEGLAWSEGWATFLGAAAHLKRDDEDAKFEFLVPRRAPIRVENVPADVCKGDKNEWRVASGLWDLYDTHVDGQDRSELSFARIWTSLYKKPMGSWGETFQLITAGMKPDELAQARATITQDTLSTTNAPSARRWWWPFPGNGGGKAMQQLVNPNFDGARQY